jgi:hypothetical protein
MVAQLAGFGGAGTLMPFGSRTWARADPAMATVTAARTILWRGRFTTRAPA